MFETLFRKFTWEHIKQWSELSNDFITYYAYRYVAELKKDTPLYDEQNAKFLKAETDLKTFLSKFYNDVKQ